MTLLTALVSNAYTLGFGIFIGIIIGIIGTGIWLLLEAIRLEESSHGVE